MARDEVTKAEEAGELDEVTGEATVTAGVMVVSEGAEEAMVTAVAEAEVTASVEEVIKVDMAEDQEANEVEVLDQVGLNSAFVSYI